MIIRDQVVGQVNSHRFTKSKNPPQGGGGLISGQAPKISISASEQSGVGSSAPVLIEFYFFTPVGGKTYSFCYQFNLHISIVSDIIYMSKGAQTKCIGE